jgi:lysophospholipase L1-like esterase
MTATAVLFPLMLAGCGGGSSSTQAVLPTNVFGTINGSPLLTRIVGVGDSLTAGEQSNGLLGKTITPNPLGALSPFPAVFATQGNGYYALLWSQANGGADPLNPAVSPLALIAPPGLGSSGSVLVPATAGGLTTIQAPCTGLDQTALTSSTALSTRLNPGATPLDVAIPGQTLHEALYQFQPTANPCVIYPNAGLQALNGILNAENLFFNPILGNFSARTTQVQAAVRVQPTLALVWLGENDLLKFTFSNGAVAASSASSFQADMTQLITSLQNAGAKVAVANVLNILAAPQFLAVPAIHAALMANGVPTGINAPITAAIDAFLSGFNVGNGGYLTLTGSTKIVAVVQASLPAIIGGTSPATAMQAGFTLLQSSSNAFGPGDYVTDSTATQTTQLVAQYNTAIAAAVGGRGAALVDVNAIALQVTGNGGVYPLPSNPHCCSIAYGGGLFSLDGIHPSNTFYALIANAFILAVNKAYGTTIPATNVATINATDPFSPH